MMSQIDQSGLLRNTCVMLEHECALERERERERGIKSRTCSKLMESHNHFQPFTFMLLSMYQNQAGHMACITVNHVHVHEQAKCKGQSYCVALPIEN